MRKLSDEELSLIAGGGGTGEFDDPTETFEFFDNSDPGNPVELGTITVTATAADIAEANAPLSDANSTLVNLVAGIYGVAATGLCTDITGGAIPNTCRAVGVVVAGVERIYILTPRDYPVFVTGTQP